MFAQLAEELRKEGDFAEAIRVCRAGLVQHPSYPSARMTLGRALFDSGDLPAARGEFEAVLRGAPDNILASRFLAESLEAMGDLGSALLQYRAALRMAPGDRFFEVQIRALEQKLTPPPRAKEAAQPARGPGIPSPPSAPAARAAPPPAPLTPGFEPAPTILLSPSPSARRPYVAVPAPPVGGTARPAPPAPPAAPPRTVRRSASVMNPLKTSRPDAPIAILTPTSRTLSFIVAREKGFEFEENLDTSLDETLDGTVEGTLDERADTPTGPRMAVSLSREKPPRAPDPKPEMGTRPVPTVSRFPFPPEPPPEAADAPPPTAKAPAIAPALPRSGPAPAPPPALPPVTPAPAAEPVRAAEAGEAPPLASSTLAELYLRQGFVDRAIEVYRQLLQREPGNERARARVEELSALLATASPGVASGPPPAAPPDERAARRRDIERTIARLEELLATVRRHAPVGGAK